jgi:streptogramin lyase
LLSAITEFRLPTADGSPGDLTVGPDGNVWFPELVQAGTTPIAPTTTVAIGRITSAGALTQFPLPTSNHFGAGDLTVGPDGNLWFPGNAIFGGTGAIVRVTPAGAISEFPLPTDGMSPGALTLGPDGNLWFTESGGPGPGAIGRITPAGAITQFPLLTADFGTATPTASDLTVGPDGDFWFTESSAFLGTGEPGPNAIGRITPSGVITDFLLPAGAGDLTVGPDGNVWFPEDGPAIGRITPAGARTDFPLHAGYGFSGDLTVGPDSNLWFPEESSVGPFRYAIGRITPAGTITEYSLPARSGAPGDLTVGPESNLWFSEYGEDPIAFGRITPSGAITTFSFPSLYASPGPLTIGPDGDLWFSESENGTPPARIGRIGVAPPRVTEVVAVAHPGGAITSILLRFDEALDPASAGKVRSYGLASGVESGQTIVFSQGVKIARVSYDRAAHAVRLKLAVPEKGSVRVTVRAGLVAADGMSSFSDFTAVVM